MPTTKTGGSTKGAKQCTVADAQYNAGIMSADDDETVICAQWDATAHWNTSDWQRFTHSLVDHGFVNCHDLSLSVREVCEAKDEETERAELAWRRAEEELATETESSPGLTAHEMRLSSEALRWRARQEVAVQTATAKTLLDAAIMSQHSTQDLTRAREALLEPNKTLIGAAKAQHIVDDILKAIPPLLKDLHSQPDTKRTMLMALSAQLRDVVVWNICAEMKEPKDRDFFLMTMGQAFLPHSADDTDLRAQILLAYHRIPIYKFHGFQSNNSLVAQRRKNPRRKRNQDRTSAAPSRYTKTREGYFSQQWPQCPQVHHASSPSPGPYVNMNWTWSFPVAGFGPQFLNTDDDPPAPQRWADHVLPEPIRHHNGKMGKGKSKRNG